MAQRRSRLSVVPTGTTAPKRKRRLTVREAAGESPRASLVALRDQIAGEIDKGVPAHALASLCRQLREIVREIEAMDQAAAEEAGERGVTPDEDFDSSAI